MRQNTARSDAVLNKPACPATPPIRRAVGSCTTPRSIVRLEASAPVAAPHVSAADDVHHSVGANRGSSDAGGLNIVSDMPSGLNRRVETNRSNGILETRATT